MREKIERLDKYMKHKGLNDNQVTVLCGLSNGLLNKARSGKTDLGKDSIEKILNRFQDLNKTWLVVGEGPMLKDAPLVEQNNVNGHNTANVNTQSTEVSELQAKLREKELEIANLMSRLTDAQTWNTRLFELLSGKKIDLNLGSKNDNENATD